MASYLRPRRGKEATAKSQNIVLKRGEVFFETPSGGVGTGIGKIKMGDGSTSYASLPYFLKQLDLNDNNTKCAFTNATAATDKSNNTTYLNNIAPSNNLKTLFQNIKQLLLNYNSQLTSLNNDLDLKNVEKITELSIGQDYSTSKIIDKYKYLSIIGIEHKLVPIWQIRNFDIVTVSLSRVSSKNIYAFQFITITHANITYDSIDIDFWEDPNIALYGIY